jgi:hypothetical protein
MHWPILFCVWITDGTSNYLTSYPSTYPNGMLTLLPAILTVFIVGLSTTAWATCDFARVQVQAVGTLATSGNADTTDAFFGGLFSDTATDSTNDVWGDLYSDMDETDDFYGLSIDTTTDLGDDFWGRELYGLFDDSITDTSSYRVGLFSREMLGFGDVMGYLLGSSSATASGCVGYSSEEGKSHDGLFKTAQVMGVICGVLSFIIMLVIWSIAPCVRLKPKGWKVLGSVLIMIGILQSLTVIGVLLSNVCRVCSGVSEGCMSHCQMSTGGILAVVASVLWLISGIVCCCIRTPEDKEGSIPTVYALNPVPGAAAPSHSHPHHHYERKQDPNSSSYSHNSSHGHHHHSYEYENVCHLGRSNKHPQSHQNHAINEHSDSISL